MRRAAALGLMLSLAACDGGGDPVEQALRETSAVNHARTVREGDVAAPSTDAAPKVATADQAYVAAMSEHHRRAIAMADAALARSRDPEIRRMAQSLKDRQTRELAEMRAWTPEPEPAP